MTGSYRRQTLTLYVASFPRKAFTQYPNQMHIKSDVQHGHRDVVVKV